MPSPCSIFNAKITPRNAYPDDLWPPKMLSPSRHRAQQLGLQDVLALLVLLRALKRLVVLPPDHLFTLSACDISYDVSAGGHVAVARFRGLGVHDAVEEEGFAMLATKVLRG